MANRIYKNLAVMTSAQFLTKVLGFIWLFLSARYLGSEQFGILSIATSIAAIFSVVMEFGFSALMIREVARDHQLIPVYMENYFSIKALLGISALILVWISTIILGYSTKVCLVTAIIAGSMFVYSFTSIATSVFFGTERMEFLSIASIAAKISSLGLGIAFIAMDVGLFWIAGVLLLERICELVINYYYVSKHYIVSYRPRFDTEFLRKAIHESLPFALAALFGMLYYKIDVIVLSKFTNEVQVGWYSAGFRFQDSFVIFFGTFVNTIFPVLSRQFGTGQISRSIVRSFEFILICVMPLSLFLFFLSDKIVLTCYGAQFAESGAVVRLLAIALPFTFMNYFLGAALSAINKQKSHFYVTAVAVALNLVLNLILIYKMQYIGAALSAVITAVCIWLLYTSVLSANIRIPIEWKFVGKFILPCLSIVAITLLGLNLLLSLILGSSVYFLLLLSTRLINKKELRELLLSFK